MSAGRLTPFQQGQLDGLCGVYAIINAIRLAIGNQASRLTAEDWRHLFHTLLVAADDAGGATNITACGIDTKPLLIVMKSAVQHMADEHELKLTVRRVLKPGERPNMRELLPRLAKVTQEQHSAVLLALTGHLDHWTVLRRVGRSSLGLFDSSGFVRVSTASCRMSQERPTPGSRNHVIEPSTLFRIAVRLA